MNAATSGESGGKLARMVRIGCMSAGLLIAVFIVLIMLAIAIPNFLAYRDKEKWDINPTLAVRQAAALGSLIRDHAEANGAEAAERTLMGKRETETVKDISRLLPSFQLPAGHPFDYAITFVMPDARDGVRFCITAVVNSAGGGDGTDGRVYYHSKVQNAEGWIDRSSITQFQTGKEPSKTCATELRQF